MHGLKITPGFSFLQNLKTCDALAVSSFLKFDQSVTNEISSKKFFALFCDNFLLFYRNAKVNIKKSNQSYKNVQYIYRPIVNWNFFVVFYKNVENASTDLMQKIKKTVM